MATSPWPRNKQATRVTRGQAVIENIVARKRTEPPTSACCLNDLRDFRWPSNYLSRLAAQARNKDSREDHFRFAAPTERFSDSLGGLSPGTTKGVLALCVYS